MIGNVVLRRLFEHCTSPETRLQSLESLLLSMKACDGDELLRSDDIAEYRACLQTTLVVRNADCHTEPLPQRSNATASLNEARNRLKCQRA
jgi:hypothetical protein